MALHELIESAFPGRRRRSRARCGEGAMVGHRPFQGPPFADISVYGTLYAAARRTVLRREPLPLHLRISDLRQRIREKRAGYAVVFVVDASSSMRVYNRLSRTKGLLLAYLKESYRNRDRVGLVSFRHHLSRLVLPLTSRISRAEREVERLEMGGKTPLAEGLALGLRALLRERCRNPESVPILIVVSDGKPNLSLYGEDPLEEALEVAKLLPRNGIRLIVIDTEDDPLAFGYGPHIAEAGRGLYRTLGSLLSASPLAGRNAGPGTGGAP